MLLNKIVPLCCLLTFSSGLFAQRQINKADEIEKKVNALLSKMTLQEKVGQLNQYTGDRAATGPITANTSKYEDIKAGKVGAMLNVRGAVDTRMVQEIAMKSRLKIPLLFGLDVIHGYRTTFPIPLAEASSWDMDAIGLSARVAATEAAGSGIHWTFAPMVDISRDPRWGRVMEGAGEDPYLGSMIAKARVKGLQGNGLGNLDAVMACVKHFAAYGAAVAGRDYNSVDMSERSLWEVYLPPFKAALDAGAATFMNSFNELNGVPATGNIHLQRDILKGKWGFKGFVVSDWGSIAEMVPHGFAKNKMEAAKLAITAGSDMDMEGRVYINNLQNLVNEKKINVELINDAVRRVLRKKFELGLFDDPYRFSNAEREKAVLENPANKIAVRNVAEKSIVLLKNQRHLLPLSKNIRTIAVIGPLGASNMDMNGAWSVKWDNDHPVSLVEGLQNKVGSNVKITSSPGCGVRDTSTKAFAEAVKAAAGADVVIMAVGESADMTGEAKSRAGLHLPGVQEKLIKAIKATGKPVVVMIMAGRPLIFPWTAGHANAILYTWWLGSEAGNAMADVLFGDYNPSAKLPMSFPRAEGQIPIFYSAKNTGRPVVDKNNLVYKSAYIDMPNSPQFAFGYGLSYTSFSITNLKLSNKKMAPNGQIRVTCTLTNTGKYAGAEVVQLYVHQLFASVTRPVKELKGFEKIFLQPGESKEVNFTIDKEKLSFYNQKLQWVTEPGDFEVMIGNSSDHISLESGFELTATIN
jgi:beta-glucosidase